MFGKLTSLDGQTELIKKLLKEHLGPKVAEIADDEAKLRSALKTVYTVLPGPIRLVVKEEKFIEFCVANKHKVLPTA